MANSVAQSCLDSVLKSQAKIPVTTVTGFLGSGKTTLLNHVLNNRQGLKVAVIVNEFGDIDIDSQLLVAVDENMVQLANGCICCTINQSLVDAVWAIANRVDSIDYLVIETTGIADLLPIVRSFNTTDLQQLTRLDVGVNILQMSGKRYAIESIPVEKSTSRSPPPNANQLVFIGRNSNAEAIRIELTKCLAI